MELYKSFVTEDVVEKFSDLEVFLKEVQLTNELTSLEGTKIAEHRLLRQQMVGTAIELYGEKNVLFLSLFKGFLMMQDLEDLQLVAKRTGTIIPKSKKRGSKSRKGYIARKLMSRWFTRGVQIAFEVVLDGYKKSYQTFREGFTDWTPEKAAERIFSYHEEYLEYLSPICEDREKLVKALQRVDLYNIARCVGDGDGADYILTQFTDLEMYLYEKNFLESLSYYLFAEEKRRLTSIEAENKELKHSLQNTIREADIQLDDALRMLDEKDQTIQDLIIEVETLRKRIESYKKLLNKGTLECELFEGQRVLVLGHPTQRDMYEEEVTLRGGIFEFVPAVADEVGFERMEGAVNRANIVLYISTYTSHAVALFIRKRTDKENFFALNCTGRDSFVSEIRRVFGHKLETPVQEEKVDGAVS